MYWYRHYVYMSVCTGIYTMCIRAHVLAFVLESIYSKRTQKQHTHVSSYTIRFTVARYNSNNASTWSHW